MLQLYHPQRSGCCRPIPPLSHHPDTFLPSASHSLLNGSSPTLLGFPGGASDKKPACQCRRWKTQVPSLGQEDPLEKGMAARSSVLAWRILWTEAPGGLQSLGSQRVGLD